MDPTANLQEQLRIARRVQGCADAGHTYRANHGHCRCKNDADRLSDLVVALDEWIRNGGFVPDAWARAGVVPRKGGK